MIDNITRCPFHNLELEFNSSNSFKVELSCPIKVDLDHDESHYHIRKYADGFLQEVCIIKPYIIENFISSVNRTKTSSIYLIAADWCFDIFNGDEIMCLDFNIDVSCGNNDKILKQIETILVFK